MYNLQQLRKKIKDRLSAWPTVLRNWQYPLGLTLLILGITTYTSVPEHPPVVQLHDPDSQQSNVVVVEVQGAVQSPGLYQLPEEATYGDAILKAGGFSQQTDYAQLSQKINLAEKVEGGSQISVPSISTETKQGPLDHENNFSRSVSINTATANQLNELPNIGEVRAQKIINERPYEDIYELVSKSIISAGQFEQIKELLTL